MAKKYQQYWQCKIDIVSILYFDDIEKEICIGYEWAQLFSVIIHEHISMP